MGKKVDIKKSRALVLIALFFSFIITLHILFSKPLIEEGGNAYILKPLEVETIGGMLISMLSMPVIALLKYEYALVTFFLLTSALGLVALYPIFLKDAPSLNKKERSDNKEYKIEKALQVEDILSERDEESYQELIDKQGLKTVSEEYNYPVNPLSIARENITKNTLPNAKKRRKIDEVFGFDEEKTDEENSVEKEGESLKELFQRRREEKAVNGQELENRQNDFKARLKAKRLERANYVLSHTAKQKEEEFIPNDIAQKDFTQKNTKFTNDYEDAFQNKYKAPSIDIYRTFPERGSMPTNFEHYRELLENALEELAIPSEVKTATRGPTFTRYELKLAKGLSIKRLDGKERDLQMRLKVQKVGIIAPIPGTDRFGVDIPNETRDIVGIKTLFQSQEYAIPRNGLELALGVTINRDPYVVDLVKMPHLMIAGATNTGKSVCINSIIMSIINKYSPEDVRLLLIDPKRVELNIYQELPHMLVKQTVCEPGHAMNALQWLVREMDRRYEYLKSHEVNNINSYNDNIVPYKDVKKMCRIVLIIDELADLMIVNKSVESYIVRLAQLARACGIHLIVATQRPSADILTRLITSNILSKIAFTVQANTDSRVILGKKGAEDLLGMGDMLYDCPQNNDLARLQGAFISQDEIKEAVSYIKANNQAVWESEIYNSIFKEEETQEDEYYSGYNNFDERSESKSYSNDEELIRNALKIIIPRGKTSTSEIQALCNVGYPKAKKLITIMEQRGYISLADGAKPRQVNISMEEFDSIYEES